jgi:two-component system chemotaxis response regulator CheB
MGRKKIKVLVVDDSPVVRKVIRGILEDVKAIDAVDTAPNGRLALRKIDTFDPDVVTMDVEMPGMDGLSVLRRIMTKSPRPVIMLSAYTFDGAAKTIRALELGAVDFIQKPESRLSRDVSAVGKELVAKVLALANSSALRRMENIAGSPAKDSLPPGSKVAPVKIVPNATSLLAIGASTGGTEAIRHILTSLPKNFPVGIVVVQHMPRDFTKAFAERLNQLCEIEIKEASHRDMVFPGRALIAPGHSHMVVRHGSGECYVELNRQPEVSGHRPSVDVLFNSMAEVFGRTSTAVMLTGMGRDGASGMARIHRAGGFTIAQDEKSCVVFGMPKTAIEEGGVDEVVHLSRIPRLIKDACASRLAGPGNTGNGAHTGRVPQQKE